ncbi:MAG: DUF1778 domain-containing protein [Rhodospirillaceae bacterium]|jgi:uncharacterized protein (DUF1778 family)
MTNLTEGKIERFGLRTTPTAKMTLKRAAAATNKSVSEFMLESGTSPLAAAEFHDQSTEKKIERIVLRISPSTKYALKRVAEAANKSMSECLLDASLIAASRVLPALSPFHI